MRRVTALWRNWFRRHRVEAELDAEVGAYLDGLADEKATAGLGREEAQRRVAIEAGGREQVKEAVRDVRFGVWLENLSKDFVHGARLLAKSPGFTAVAVLTLALGMGPNIAIFSFVNGILLRPLPYPESSSLVQIFHTNSRFRQGADKAPVSPGTFNDWRQQSKTVERISAFGTRMLVVTGGEPERVSAARVSAGFFATLGVMPMLGQPFAAEAERSGNEQGVILSYGLWQRRMGGRADAVGKTLEFGSTPYTIAGVMPRGFSYPEGVEVWVPLVFGPGEMNERGSMYLEVLGHRKSGVTLEAAQAEFSAMTAQIRNAYPAARALGARVASLHGEKVKGVRATLALLFAAVTLVMLIACVNAANLIQVRGMARSRDLAVRAALGAGRGRLLQQSLSECLLIAVGGAGLGLLVAAWSLDGLRAISPANVPRLGEVTINGAVVLFAAALALVTSVLFGLLPAWRATQVDLGESLKDSRGGQYGGQRRRLRGTLVVVEVALSLVLLVGAGLMLRTTWSLLSQNPGFDPRNVLTADVFLPRGKYVDEEQQTRFALEVVERIRALPGVLAADVTTSLPLSGGYMTASLLIEGQTPQSDLEGNPGSQRNPQTADVRSVSAGYFDLMRIPLIRGRGLSRERGQGGPPIAIVNQAMAARYWPGADPIGQHIRLGFGREWIKIVGIVGDVRQVSLRSAPGAEVYLPWEQAASAAFRLAVRTSGNPEQWASALRQAVWLVDKDQPVTRLRSMEGVLFATVAEPRFLGVLFSVFAMVALMLAGFGIYSVMAYTVMQRTREIGIRMALGARGVVVLGQFLGEGLRLALWGTVLGIAGALYASRWVEKMLFGVTRSDPMTFALVAGVLVGAALTACLVPAWRAARVDPLVALRHE